jgi:diguanylate cyclase (GGDEF)-like protein
MQTVRDMETGRISTELLFRRLSAVSAGIVAVIALGVLAGWQFGIELLMTGLPGYIRMKPNTALAFLGVAAALLIEYRGGSLRLRRFGALASLVLGGGTVFEYVTGLSLHIDQLFFTDTVQVIYPGRMAPVTAINFLLLGIALLWRTRPHSPKRASSSLALVVVTSSIFAIVGYLYGVPVLYGSTHYTAMALHTGISFLLLSLAIVFLDPTSMVAKLVWSTGAGGVVARRLLPVAVVLPIILGRIFVSSTFNHGDLRLAMAFKAMSSTLLFAAVIAHLCHTLNTTSRKMRDAETSLQMDGLTGIYNRRYFDQRLQEEIATSRRDLTPLSLILFDADHFKRVNDVHGHLAGDEVLKALATVTSIALRTTDAACRYGGEEFAVILPQTSLEQATAIAERTRILVAQWVEAATGIHTTISLGATCLINDDEQGGDLIARADHALYEAKRSGRNCVRTRPSRLYEVARPAVPDPDLAQAV